jgi:hypothetical protein
MFQLILPWTTQTVGMQKTLSGWRLWKYDKTNCSESLTIHNHFPIFQSRNALLEVRNESLVGKLENQELKAKIRELMEENAALKQTNVEQMVQLDRNQVIR